MKIKGINVFEMHCEKIVLGAAFAVTGLIAVSQFVFSPNSVDFGGETYAPSKVDEAIQQRGESLGRQLASDAHIPDFDPGPSLVDWFRNEQQGATNVNNSDRVAQAYMRPVPLQFGKASTLDSSQTVYASFAPGAPNELKVVSRPWTLSDAILDTYPELQSHLPNTAPYDVTSVLVSAKVDGTKIREMLLTASDESAAIPPGWWDNDMEIVDIVVERQRWLETQEWGATETVDTIPGQSSVRTDIAGAMSSDSPQIINSVFEYGQDLYQPQFYTLLDDEPWDMDMVRAMEPLSPEAEEAVTKMIAAWKGIQKADRRLMALTKTDGRDNRPGSGEGKGGTGLSGGGESGGQSTTRQTADERRKAQKKKREDDAREAVTNAQELYQEMKEEVLILAPLFSDFPDEEPVEDEDDDRRGGGQESANPDEGGGMHLGGGFEGGGGKGEGYSTTTRGNPRRDTRRNTEDGNLALFDDEAREVWAHDLSAVRGATYRYRMRVDYVNPFFGRTERLSDDQQAMAASLNAPSEYTDWSESVNVVSTKQFYCTVGNWEEAIERRSASFEVFVYTSGEQRMESISVRPGEPIGETRTYRVEKEVSEDDEDDAEGGLVELNVDFSTGAVLLDVIEIKQGKSSRDRVVQVLVALEDGTIVAYDPAQQKAAEDRRRLLEMTKKE